jgi:hypothetical protein
MWKPPRLTVELSEPMRSKQSEPIDRFLPSVLTIALTAVLC